MTPLCERYRTNKNEWVWRICSWVGYLCFVGIDQRGCGSHHGAAPRARQRSDQWFWDTFGPLLENLSQPLEVVHQCPVHPLLCPVGLQKAAQNRDIKVGGIASTLRQGCWHPGRGWRPEDKAIRNEHCSLVGPLQPFWVQVRWATCYFVYNVSIYNINRCHLLKPLPVLSRH